MVTTTVPPVISVPDLARRLGVTAPRARRVLDKAAAMGVVRLSFLGGGRRAIVADDLPRVLDFARSELEGAASAS